MSRFGGVVGVFVAAVFLGACSSAPMQVCVPGKSEPCTGPGGCAGGQRCNDQGTGYGACECGTGGGTGGGMGGGVGGGTGGGTGGGVGGGTGGGTGGGADDAGTGGGMGGGGGGGEDAGVDGGTDGGATCDPLAAPGANGCSASQKCAWVVLQETPTPLGELRCVPDGTVAASGACTQGAAGPSGYDDCVNGLVCVGGACVRTCTVASGAECSPWGSCTRYAGLFANGSDDPLYGACSPACDPVAQVQLDGGSCGGAKGCYLLTSSTTTLSICAGAGSVAVGAEITGGVFANSCVPGAQPRRRDQSTNVVECGALCRPNDVTQGMNTADEGGVSPETCASRGAALPGDATAGESCRFWWGREPFTTLSPFSNTVGWCFKHATFLYDSNMDGTFDAPWPRCVDLTTGDVLPPISNPPGNDALEFWCIQSPSMRARVAGAVKPPWRSEQPLVDRVAGWR